MTPRRPPRRGISFHRMSPSAVHADHPQHRVWVTDLLLLFMATIWGVNFSVVKLGMRHVEPMAFNAVRVVLAGCALLLIARVRRLGLPPRHQLWALLGLGVLGNGLIQLAVPSYWIDVAGGALLLVAVGFDQVRVRLTHATT